MEEVQEERWLLHDGSVDDRLNVVLPVPGVDDPLSLGGLFDVLLCEDLKAHVRRHRLREGERHTVILYYDTGHL